MGFETSPSVDLYKNGLPDKLPDPPRRRLIVRILLLVSIIVVILLSVISLMNGPVGNQLRGTGLISGRVIDVDGRPLPADVLILQSKKAVHTLADGTFTLSGIPAGERFLVATHQGQGVEIKINVVTGSTLAVGDIIIAATALPPP